MNITKWQIKNIGSLSQKTAVVTGATGGLGKELCFMLAGLGAHIILACRNESLANSLKTDILEKYPNAKIDFVSLDLANLSSVDNCIIELQTKKIDFFFINAGVYNVPLKKMYTALTMFFK